MFSGALGREAGQGRRSGSETPAGGDGPSRGDQRIEDRAARPGAVVRSAPCRRGAWAQVSQSAGPRGRVRQERRGSGRDAEARLRLRRGRHADAAAASRQRPPAAVPIAEDAAVINRYGFNNEGFERARARLERRPPGLIGVNLGANKDAADRVEDYALGVRTFAAVADYLTINVSSPNTPGLRDLQRREALDDLIARVVEARDETEPHRPLMLKIAPDLDARGLEDIVATALSRRIDGLIISNTTVARPATLTSRNRGETGGLSGALYSSRRRGFWLAPIS